LIFDWKRRKEGNAVGVSTVITGAPSSETTQTQVLGTGSAAAAIVAVFAAVRASFPDLPWGPAWDPMIAAALLSVAGAGYKLFAHGQAGKTVWQLDPNKCVACGNCANYCVLQPSAVKCVHAYASKGFRPLNS
jgi:NAD-dependent dihydropyrimidine dehydrogenase PreA subunit